MSGDAGCSATLKSHCVFAENTSVALGRWQAAPGHWRVFFCVTLNDFAKKMPQDRTRLHAKLDRLAALLVAGLSAAY